MLRLLIILIFLAPFSLSGQCENADQHNTSEQSMWRSCAERESPLGGDETSHWVMYQFDQAQPIEGIHLWNINHPQYLSDGASEIKIETSSDGATWVARDTLTLDRASGSNEYVGQSFDEFEAFEAQYILLTVIENHGGRCTGLSEVKFVLGEVSTSDDYLKNQVSVAPNPGDQQIVVDISELEASVSSYQITDMLGRVHLHNNVAKRNIKSKLSIGTSSLPDGNYALHLTTDKGIIAKSIIVVHPN